MSPIKDIKQPNFLISGVAKSGTTSVFHCLKGHPEVYVPRIKETFFFISSVYKKINPEDPHYETIVNRTICSFEDYVSLFTEVNEEKAIGEVGTFYSYYYETAIPRIKEYLGDIKIIIILRNPIDRAFSAYTHFYRYNLEVLPFEEGLYVEENRKNNNWYTMWFYKDVGFYYEQVKAYMKGFSQVKVCLYDDLKKDTIGLMKDIYNYIGVDSSFIPDVSTKHMMSGIPHNRLVHYLINKPNFIKRMLKPIIDAALSDEKKYKIICNINAKNLVKPEIKPETRKYLKNVYREDVLKLQDLINRDLSNWIG